MHNIAINYLVTTSRNKIVHIRKIINLEVRFHYHIFLKLFLFHIFLNCIVLCIKIILKCYVNNVFLFCKTFRCVIYQNVWVFRKDPRHTDLITTHRYRCSINKPSHEIKFNLLWLKHFVFHFILKCIQPSHGLYWEYEGNLPRIFA